MILVDRSDAGAIGCHLASGPFPYRALPLRCDPAGPYDRNGAKRRAPESNGFGSLTYLNYGLLDKLTIGVIPTFGYNRVSDAPSSSSVEMGDVTVQGQYRLTRFHEGSRIPTMSL